jgi:hypothetical protein
MAQCSFNQALEKLYCFARRTMGMRVNNRYVVIGILEESCAF